MAGGFWRVFPFTLATWHGHSYIEIQQKHHAKKSFREEYIELLEQFNVDYDHRYIFKMGDE